MTQKIVLIQQKNKRNEKEWNYTIPLFFLESVTWVQVNSIPRETSDNDLSEFTNTKISVSSFFRSLIKSKLFIPIRISGIDVHIEICYTKRT